MKDLGEIRKYLGINIIYDNLQGLLKMDQTKYIENLCEKFNIAQSKSFKTPMEQNLKLTLSESDSLCSLPYRNLIGALLYIANCTRPDISFATNYLSRFQNSFTQEHYRYALRVLKYLHCTKDLCLSFGGSGDSQTLLDVYVDADWAALHYFY